MSAPTVQSPVPAPTTTTATATPTLEEVMRRGLPPLENCSSMLLVCIGRGGWFSTKLLSINGGVVRLLTADGRQEQFAAWRSVSDFLEGTPSFEGDDMRLSLPEGGGAVLHWEDGEENGMYQIAPAAVWSYLPR
jgi:hypothetical protein